MNFARPAYALLALVSVLVPVGCGRQPPTAASPKPAERFEFSTKPPGALPELPADEPGEPDRSLTWREVPLPPHAFRDAIAFSPDGSRLAVVGPKAIHIIAVDTGLPIAAMEADTSVSNPHVPPTMTAPYRLAFTADGDTLGFACDKALAVQFFDTRTGRRVRELALPAPTGNASIGGPFLDISPGATRIAVRGACLPSASAPLGSGRIDILDASDGSLVQRFETGPCYLDGRFSPDGRVFAGYSYPGLHVGAWEVSSGRQLLAASAEGDRMWAGPHLLLPDTAENLRGGMSSGFLSPDNRLLVTDAYEAAPAEVDLYLLVWRLGVKAEGPAARVPVPGGPGKPGYVTLTSALPGPGGRVLVVCTAKSFAIYDLVRQEYRPEFKGPAEECTHATLSPDGATLTVVARSSRPRTDGGTLSVYLTRFPRLGPPIRPGGEWTAAEKAFLWDGVASRNEFRRAYCTRAFTGRTDEALVLAQASLRAVPAAETKRVREAIGQLVDDRPGERDKAVKELRASVHTFGPLLRTALRDAPEGPVRNSLTIILDPFRPADLPAGLEAQLRQIELLERIGTPAAQRLLREVADGAPGARLTVAAAAALERLTGH